MDNHLNASPELAMICGQFERYYTFRLVVDVFVVSIFILGGFVGNTLAFLVMRVDNTNNTVSYLLQALAVADNLYLLLCVFFQVLKALTECSNWIPVLKYTFPYMEPYIWPLASIVQTTGVWLVVIVTFDRYIAICHPFNTAYKGTRSKAKKATYIIIMLAILYNIPRFFEQTTVEQMEYCSNTTRLTSTQTDLRRNPIYFIVYKTCLYFLFRVVIPLATLTVLNAKLILVLRSATRSHAVLTRTAPPRSDPFTRILVAVVTVFLFCQLPSFILRTVVTVKAFTGWNINVWYWATLSNVLLTINSSINCVVYCISGPRFRKILQKLCSRICFGRGNLNDHALYGEEQSNLNGTLTTMSQRRSTVRQSQQRYEPPQKQQSPQGYKEHYKVKEGMLCRTVYQDTVL